MFGVKLRGKALTAVILACAGLDFLEFGYDQGLLVRSTGYSVPQFLMRLTMMNT